MFEKEIQYISDYAFNKISGLGNSFVFEKLNQTSLHPAIYRFISAEIDYLAYRESSKNGEVPDESFYEAAEELKKFKKISVDDFKKLIIQAVSFNLNFLLKPNWSIIKLIYNGDEEKPVEELKVFLNYLYYYPHIKQIILKYFDVKEEKSFNKNELVHLLSKIDQNVIAQDIHGLLKDAIISMSDFFNEGESNRNQLYSNYIETYLREKKLTDILDKFKRFIPTDTKVRVKVEFLLEFFDNEINKLNEQESAKTEIEEEPLTSSYSNYTENETEVNSYEEEEIEEDEDTEESVQEPLFSDDDLEDKDDINNIDFEKYEQFKENVSDKNLNKIVEKVFNKDEYDFLNTLQKVFECTTFENATEILKEVFSTYRVNPYSKEAKIFTDAVADYFYRKK